MLGWVVLPAGVEEFGWMVRGSAKLVVRRLHLIVAIAAAAHY